jgi:hypothetical protein
MRNSIQILAATILVFSLAGAALAAKSEAGTDDGFARSFDLDQCTLSPNGSNSYFFLHPGYQLTLEGQDDGDRMLLVLTVLNETRIVDGVETRVVEERESENGELVEVSVNYFAVCTETGDIYYFGEEVDMYEDGAVKNHEGAWLAGEDGATAGLLYPANPQVGMKFYQEVAPGVAEDRAEIISLDEVLKVPAGNFSHVLKVEETTPLEPRESEFKYYAAGVGLLQDEDLKLTKYVIPEVQNVETATLRPQPQSLVVGDQPIEIQLNSSSTVSKFALDEPNKVLTFEVSGQAGVKGTTEIYIGKILDGPYTVAVDGAVLEDIELIQDAQTNASIIRIPHDGNSRAITVSGTNVVPEFPLPAISIALLAVSAMVLYARFRQSGRITLN